MATMPVPETLLDEVESALESEHPELARRLRLVREPALTAPQAAKLLGVSSPNTVKNWLKGGHFPGAYQTSGGHWRFPRSSVLEMKAHLDELRARNARGDLTPPELDADPPLL